MIEKHCFGGLQTKIDRMSLASIVVVGACSGQLQRASAANWEGYAKRLCIVALVWVALHCSHELQHTPLLSKGQLTLPLGLPRAEKGAQVLAIVR